VASWVADQVRLGLDDPPEGRSSSELAHQDLAQKETRKRFCVARNAFALERDDAAGWGRGGGGDKPRTAIGGNVGSPGVARGAYPRDGNLTCSSSCGLL
jgi:hypothetical protein